MNSLEILSIIVPIIVSISALILSTYSVWNSHRASRSARSIAVVKEIYDTLTHPQAREDRKFVYGYRDWKKDDFERLCDTDNEKYQRLLSVAVAFSNVGLFVEEGYISDKVVNSIFGLAIINCGKVLEELVRYEREQRKESFSDNAKHYYLKHFDSLVKEAKIYVKKEHLELHKLYEKDELMYGIKFEKPPSTPDETQGTDIQN